jgi:hypothetical protein
MPSVAERMADRWEPTDVTVPAVTKQPATTGGATAEDVE